ncbi:MAG: CvpA family protein [Clostridia bacterium]|nr:CvpA family protein [Clostridia bacterium]
MSIVIDVLILAIIIICAYISAKHGFVRSVIEIAGFLAAVWITFLVASPMANYCYDKFIHKEIVNSATDAAESYGEKSSNAIWDSLPEVIKNNSERIGISSEDFIEKTVSGISSGAKSSVEAASKEIIKPVIVKVLGLLFSVIILIILMIIVKFLAKLLNKLFSFSIVGKLNRMLGGIAGAAKGVIVAFAFCLVISLIISFTKNGIFFFTEENIDKTVIFKFLLSFSPFK